MGRDKRNEQRVDQFTPWVLAHRQLPAWKALSFPAREAYFHLQIRCMADTAQRKPKMTNNNGEIFRSLRCLAEDMGCSVKTAGAALADLQAKGWIACTSEWERGIDGTGKTATFRLTMFPMGKGNTFQPASQEPKAWSEGEDYPIAVYASYAPKPRKGRIKNVNHPPIRARSTDKPCATRARVKPSIPEIVRNSGTQNGKLARSAVPYSDTYLECHIPDNSSDLSKCMLAMPSRLEIPHPSQINPNAPFPARFSELMER